MRCAIQTVNTTTATITTAKDSRAARFMVLSPGCNANAHWTIRVYPPAGHLTSLQGSQSASNRIALGASSQHRSLHEFHPGAGPAPTSCRAIVSCAAALVPWRNGVPPDFPQPGWVEHDPLEIWRKRAAVAREALAPPAVEDGDRRYRDHQPARDDLLWDRTEPGNPSQRDRVAVPATGRICDALKRGGRELIAPARQVW